MDFPPIASLTRLWYASPNAQRIEPVFRKFAALPPLERELFLLGLDIEEGILPLVHVGGRVSRQTLIADRRLIGGGGYVDYCAIIAAARAAVPLVAPSPPTSPTPSAAPGPAAPEAACPPRRLIPEAITQLQQKARPMSPGEVLAQDRLAMDVWFPAFQLVVHRDGPPWWQGPVAPLGAAGPTFVLQALYAGNHLSPLRMRVIQPVLHPQAPHRYLSGDLCTFYPPLGSWVRGRAGDDLVELLRFATTWLVRYVCWTTFEGWWPGLDVPHDPAYLVATLRDDDYCPYHSPQRWGSCCKQPHTRALGH